MVRTDRKIKYYMSFVYMVYLMNNIITVINIKKLFKEIKLYFNLE